MILPTLPTEHITSEMMEDARKNISELEKELAGPENPRPRGAQFMRLVSKASGMDTPATRKRRAKKLILANTIVEELYVTERGPEYTMIVIPHKQDIKTYSLTLKENLELDTLDTHLMLFERIPATKTMYAELSDPFRDGDIKRIFKKTAREEGAFLYVAHCPTEKLDIEEIVEPLREIFVRHFYGRQIEETRHASFKDLN